MNEQIRIKEDKRLAKGYVEDNEQVQKGSVEGELWDRERNFTFIILEVSQFLGIMKTSWWVAVVQLEGESALQQFSYLHAH